MCCCKCIAWHDGHCDNCNSASKRDSITLNYHIPCFPVTPDCRPSSCPFPAQALAPQGWSFRMHASMLEVYNEDYGDLLAPKGAKKEGKIKVGRGQVACGT